MPYIRGYQRIIIDDGGQPRNVGELNYKFSRLMQRDGTTEDDHRKVIDDWVNFRGLNYETINAVIGAAHAATSERIRRGHTNHILPLTIALQQWYREIVGPYENKKIEQNGDIYDT